MKSLIQGVHRFQNEVFGNQKELFEHLAHGQTPHALFITCSDSRINPAMITQANPGEIFIMRNAGNIVPPFGLHPGGEAATIEYAVEVLGVNDIIVCGHSDCGAMKALVKPLDTYREMPAINAWLNMAETTRRIMKTCHPDLEGEEAQDVAVKENVLGQIENLQTHPSVRARMREGTLLLHGWMYYIKTGEVQAFDPVAQTFKHLPGPDEPGSRRDLEEHGELP